MVTDMDRVTSRDALLQLARENNILRISSSGPFSLDDFKAIELMRNYDSVIKGASLPERHYVLLDD